MPSCCSLALPRCGGVCGVAAEAPPGISSTSRPQFWVALVLTLPFAAVRFALIRPEARALELTVAWSTIAAYVLLTTGAALLARRFLVMRPRPQAQSRNLSM